MGISRDALPIALFVIFAPLLAATRPSAQGQSQGAAQQPQGSFLGVDGSKIYYEECGTGPEVVVLIHDGIANSVVWDGVWPAFCKQFHTIRYDRHGYGRSPVTTQPYFETDDKYVIAADHGEARKKLNEILTASPQDLTHDDMARPTRPAIAHLSEIRVPTRILVGDQDIPDVHAHAGVIENDIPNSRRVVVEDTGQLMYLEKPDAFSRLVIIFLQGNRN